MAVSQFSPHWYRVAAQRPAFGAGVRVTRQCYRDQVWYVLVNAALSAINYLTNPGRIWYSWATFGWGIGLLAHGLAVFAFGGWFGARWEDRKIREYLSRHP